MTKKGYRQTPEHIRNHAQTIKGISPWSKGLTKETDLRIAKLAEANRIRLTGVPRPKTQEHIDKIRQKLIGRPGVTKGKKIPALSKALKGRKITWVNKISAVLKGRKHTPEIVEKNRQAHLLYYQTHEHPCKGRALAPEHREKIRLANLRNKEGRREALKALWKTPEFIAKQIKAKHATPNKAEKRLNLIIEKACPGKYRFVGDGSVIIGRINPDFLNINGRKKIIELYGDYWHKNANPQERITKFKDFGFDCLIIWEHELSDSDLELRIRAFNQC